MIFIEIFTQMVNSQVASIYNALIILDLPVYDNMKNLEDEDTS
jgi:hypothetical protein